MPAPRAPLERVIVIGGGTTALLCACTLKKAVPHAHVILIPAPVDRSALADHCHSGTPEVVRYHEKLGLDAAMVLRRAEGTHRLATRFEGWNAAAPFTIGYGAAPDPAGEPSFRAGWMSRAPDPDSTGGSISVAAALAIKDLFALPSDDATSPFADLDYALRFDPDAFRRGLQALARHMDVELIPSGLRSVNLRSDGAIDGIGTTDGHGFAADLYFDCAGMDALASRMPGSRDWVDWSGRLPVDRILPGPERTAAPSPLDEVVAQEAGYRLISPGRASAHMIYCYASALIDDEAAARSIGAQAADAISLKAGRAAEAWTHNLIRIGDSAAAFEPLGWLNLHHAVKQLELLAALLPGRDIEPLERQEFNRRAAMLADRIADFIAAHHCRAAGGKTAFEKHCAGLARSPTLSRTLDEFVRRGRLPHHDDEAVPRDLWWQLLAALGVGPGPAARLLALPPASLDERRRAHEHRVAAALAQAPLYREWLAAALGATRT
ncbi:tryptophan 7-halogenase [Sphingopyxis sp.]|uniref:tryptophan 7-halogenase n=1 Tax=Sphingopyxis sp. TaxID=1908224 RepID=UPI002B463911|nr:tryptophan 7-halogenase [Sphingopyxis sp.]HJS12643.1 tryptophan 7-halogenase [Sphingopyxis sp.]